jgi:uncharacterized protein YndB with AHSA1/START domain
MTTPESTERTHEGRTITLEMRTKADPDLVWRAWTDPEMLSQWFADRAWGEAKPGNVLMWAFDAFGYEVPYPVLEAVPGERLVLGGELPGRPPFLLEITIRREGGETVLRLVNSGFLEGDRWDEEYEGVLSGWEMALALLRLYVERYAGIPKRSALIMRPVPISPGEAFPWFTDAERLQRWFAASGAPSAVGAPYALTLSDGAPMRGTTLAISRREVALSWDDERMAVELKAFPAPTIGPCVCIRLTSWGADEARAREIEERMTRSVERLAAAVHPAP